MTKSKALFNELVTGEAVAEVSEARLEHEAEPVAQAMDDEILLPDAPQEAVSADDDADELEAIMAQMSMAEQEAPDEESGGISAELDNELASLLEQLDKESEDGDWMAEIQQGSLELGAENESVEYMEDFDREWVKDAEGDETGGAPWLSAAMREALDQDEDGSYDLFGDDEQLQNLLNRTSDTEPIHRSDIEDWLNEETTLESSEERRTIR